MARKFKLKSDVFKRAKKTADSLYSGEKKKGESALLNAYMTPKLHVVPDEVQPGTKNENQPGTEKLQLGTKKAQSGTRNAQSGTENPQPGTEKNEISSIPLVEQSAQPGTINAPQPGTENNQPGTENKKEKAKAFQPGTINALQSGTKNNHSGTEKNALPVKTSVAELLSPDTELLSPDTELLSPVGALLFPDTELLSPVKTRGRPKAVLPSPQQLKLLQCLHSMQTENGLPHTDWISRAMLAEKVGTTKDAVRTQVKRLKSGGYLTIKASRPGRYGGCTTYAVTQKGIQTLVQPGTKIALSSSSRSKDINTTSTSTSKDGQIFGEQINEALEYFPTVYGLDYSSVIKCWHGHRQKYDDNKEAFVASLMRYGWELEQRPQKIGRGAIIKTLQIGPYPLPKGFKTKAQQRLEAMEAELAEQQRKEAELLQRVQERQQQGRANTFFLWVAELGGIDQEREIVRRRTGFESPPRGVSWRQALADEFKEATGENVDFLVEREWP